MNLKNNELGWSKKESISIDGVDLNNYQSKKDNKLTTTDKTIVGAINELNPYINYIKNDKYYLLSEELAKSNKTINEIIMEKKRILIDGVYEITDTIILTGSGFNIKGIGYAKIIQTTPGKATFQLGNNGVAFSVSSISDLIIEGNRNTETSKTGSGILVDFAYGVKFSNICVYHCGGYGLECKNESNKNGLWITKFDKCTFSYNYKGGVYFNHSNGTQFNDISFYLCTIQGNGFKTNADGTCSRPSGASEALENYGDGLSVSGTAISIIGCDSEGNGSAGIRLNNGYKSGIAITGNYLEPNFLTNFYITKSIIDFFCKGNYMMESNNYKLGKYYIENNVSENDLIDTQFIDKKRLLNTDNHIKIFTQTHNNIKDCYYTFNKGFDSNFKITMKYKSLMNHGYMSFGLNYRNKKESKPLSTRINKSTLKSNICKIQSINNNVITLDSNLVETDSTWTKLYIHCHSNNLPEYKGTFGWCVGVVSNSLLIDSTDVNILNNIITLSNLSDFDLEMIKKCTHVTLQTPIVNSSESVFDFMRIPVSTDKYNTLVYYNSTLQTDDFAEAREIIDYCSIWGMPCHYENANHIMDYLKLEQTDIVYIKETDLNKISNPYNGMKVFTLDTHKYLTYHNGEYI